MDKLFSLISRFMAVIFALLFVITTIMAVVLTTINQQLFSANLFKNALLKEQIYERLPSIIGKALTTSSSYNPCAGNPLACENISAELKACFEQTLGTENYATLTGGKDQPTEAEQTQIQACIDQYGSPNDVVSPEGSGGQGGMPPFFRNLSTSDWEILIKLVLPPKEMQGMVEGGIDQFIAYLNGETDTVKLSMTKIKDHLAGQAGIEMIKQILHSQPACTETELSRILAGLASGEVIFCNPVDDATLAKMLPNLQGQLDSAESAIPDEAVLIKPPTTSLKPGNNPLGADPIRLIRILRLILHLSLLVPLAFLLMVTLFAVRSIKSWMLWWGIPFLVSGIMVLTLGIFTQPVITKAWVIFIIPRIPPAFPTEVASIGLDLIRSIVHSLTNGFFLWTTILLAFGLAAWIGSYFIKPKHP
jgi:hypothetical protein